MAQQIFRGIHFLKGVYSVEVKSCWLFVKEIPSNIPDVAILEPRVLKTLPVYQKNAR